MLPPRARTFSLTRLVEPEHRRDFLAFFGDLLFFGVALSFISRTTVLPSLVRRLTGSAPLVGLVETTCNGAWLVPQLFAARFLATRKERKRYVVRPVLVQRLAFLAAGPMLLVLGARNPGLAALMLFPVLGVFYALDAFASVAWFDLLTLAMPPGPRARLIGLSQLCTGIAGIGCGFVVGGILGSERIAFPLNYALLFGLAGVSFIFGLGAIISLREHPGHAVATPAPIASFLKELIDLLRTDRRFAVVIGVRLLVGASGMATPFYILHALDGLGYGPESIGFFTAAQLGGGIASSLLMAGMSERKGTRAVIRLCAGLAMASPLIALAAHASRSVVPMAGLRWIYAMVFVTLGALANGGLAGFMSYLLEFAPAEHRTVYIGLANTLTGVVLIMPFIGGWILAASSYPILFAVTAAVSSLGFLGSLRVSEPRHRNPPGLTRSAAPGRPR